MEPHDNGFEAKSRAFLVWFKGLPGARFHHDISIRDLRERKAGRGIIATADIPPETLLFSIPRSAIICTDTSEIARKLPGLLLDVGEGAVGEEGEGDDDAGNEGDTPAPLDSWASLILVVMYEALQGGRSPWKPYLDVLPRTFETPMFWSDPELAELQASPMLSRVGREEAETMFRTKILPVIRQNEAVFYPPGSRALDEPELRALFNRTGSTIMAYAFDLEPDEEEGEEQEGGEQEDGWVEDREGKTKMGMVPMADILNADAEFNAHVNHGEDQLTVTALRHIRAGEEILNYYGPLPNSELLRRYGYVTPKHGRYDVVDLPWELLLSATKQQLQLNDAAWGRVMDRLEPEEMEESFILERETGEPDSTGVPPAEAAVTELPPDMRDQMKTLLKAARAVDGSLVPDRTTREQVFLQVVSAALDARLRQYPTSIQDDRRLVADGNVFGRLRMAVEVRLGEKQLLAETMAFVGARLREADGHAEVDGPASKRRRTARA